VGHCSDCAVWFKFVTRRKLLRRRQADYVTVPPSHAALWTWQWHKVFFLSSHSATVRESVTMVSMLQYLTGSVGLSGFGSATTAENVAAAHAATVAGKVVLITGAASGIGLEAARVLAGYGATVYVGARTQAKADEAIKTIRDTAVVRPDGPAAADQQLRPFVADLGSFASIHAGVNAFLADNVPLHILLNNAGTAGGARGYQRRVLTARHAGRRHGVAAHVHGGRPGTAVWHQPYGPLLLDHAPPRQAQGVRARARRQRQLVRAPRMLQQWFCSGPATASATSWLANCAGHHRRAAG
jgi:NAD(P)-dependent dehydrogenase (short-subunit alcohol dehydrogenase family)